MTGTGTQNDPYVVYTLEELLSVNGANYITLGADIDANAEGYEYVLEPIKIGGNGSPCTFDGAGHKISNLTIRNTNFFQFTTGSYSYNGYLVNTDFINCKLIGGGFFIRNNTINHNMSYIQNCKFSIAVNGQGYGIFFLDNTLTMEECAVDITYSYLSAGQIGTIVSAGCAVRRSTFIIRVSDGSVIWSSPLLFYYTGIVTIVDSGFIFVGCKFANSSGVNICVKPTSSGANTSIFHCYFVFDNCKYTTYDSSISSVGFDATYATSNLCCISDCEHMKYNNDAPYSKITKEQIQSKEYLQSIGWLP